MCLAAHGESMPLKSGGLCARFRPKGPHCDLPDESVVVTNVPQLRSGAVPGFGRIPPRAHSPLAFLCACGTIHACDRAGCKGFVSVRVEQRFLFRDVQRPLLSNRHRQPDGAVRQDAWGQRHGAGAHHGDDAVAGAVSNPGRQLHQPGRLQAVCLRGMGHPRAVHFRDGPDSPDTRVPGRHDATGADPCAAVWIQSVARHIQRGLAALDFLTRTGEHSREVPGARRGVRECRVFHQLYPGRRRARFDAAAVAVCGAVRV